MRNLYKVSCDLRQDQEWNTVHMLLLRHERCVITPKYPSMYGQLSAFLSFLVKLQMLEKQLMQNILYLTARAFQRLSG